MKEPPNERRALPTITATELKAMDLSQPEPRPVPGIYAHWVAPGQGSTAAEMATVVAKHKHDSHGRVWPLWRAVTTLIEDLQAVYGSDRLNLLVEDGLPKRFRTRPDWMTNYSLGRLDSLSTDANIRRYRRRRIRK
jgi:hypothetical protein